MLISCFGHVAYKTWVIPAEIIVPFTSFLADMWSGSDEKTSGHGGGVGRLSEVEGDSARAAGTGSGNVGDATGIGGVEKLISAKLVKDVSGLCMAVKASGW
jgi:hypothetical protein